MVRFAAAALALAVTSFGLSAYGAESQILLLDFWSPQCGPCMSMKPTMHRSSRQAIQFAKLTPRTTSKLRNNSTSTAFRAS